ncbi:endodeoxyribonuclease [Agrobacterium sp. DKPNP3]|uniref:endodeoxyribonuclease n=1 Tax=Agrobacterium sp. DKPNP3 TaxID=3457323 RepID=UPI004043A892
MRNRFEQKVAKTLGPEYAYEALRLTYTVQKKYLPDFIDVEAKKIVEAKGRFTAEDRSKHKAIKAQHPDWDVTIVFQNAQQTITKISKTTYADWCDANGIKWQQL